MGIESLGKRTCICSETPEKHTSGPKGPGDFTGVIVRAEALTYQSRPTARVSFPAACRTTWRRRVFGTAFSGQVPSTQVVLCWCSQQQVAADQPEKDISRPGGQGSGQVIHTSHCAEEPIDYPVGQRHRNGHRDAGERAAAAHRKCKWNRQHCHHDGDERVREFVPQGNAQAHGIKAALAQVVYVPVQLAEVHLLRLQALFLEVGGLLVNLGEDACLELSVIGYAGAVNFALPTILEFPGFGSGVPCDTGGKNTSRDREGARIKLEQREIGELVAVRVKELVVEDAAGLAGMRLAEDPLLLGMKKCLWRGGSFWGRGRRLARAVRR